MFIYTRVYLWKTAVVKKCISREGKESSCEDEQLRRRLLLKITSCRETTAAGDPSAKFDFAGFVIFSFFGFDQVGVGNLAETAQVDNL